MSKLLDKWFSGNSFNYHYVFSLLLPVIVDQLFLYGFNFLNTAMISNAGQSAISAVNIVSSLNYLFIQIFMAVGLGGTVLIAQYFGNGQRKILGFLVNGTVYGTVLTGLTLAIIVGFFHNTILDLLFGRATVAVMTDARIYLIGILLSYPFEAIVEGTNGSLRGIGRTQNSLELSLIMNSLYMILNVVFIMVIHLGIVGMIMALNISRWTAAICAVFMLITHRHTFSLNWQIMHKINWHMVFKVIKVCIPFATDSIFFNGGKILIQMMIVGLGTQVIVTNAIASSWMSLSEIVPQALATALVPIIGRCIGKKENKDAIKITKSFIGLSYVMFILGDGLLMLTFSHGILLFNPAPSLIPKILEIYTIFFTMHILVWSLSFVLPSALRAAGDGPFTTYVSLGSMWLFRVAGGYIFGIVLGYGLVGITIVWVIEWAVRASFFVWRFHSRKWLTKRLIK